MKTLWKFFASDDVQSAVGSLMLTIIIAVAILMFVNYLSNYDGVTVEPPDAVIGTEVK